MKLSLSASLTLWFGGLASLVVGVGAVALYLGVKGALQSSIDARLETVAHGLGALCEWEDGTVHLEGAYEIDGHVPELGRGYGFEILLHPGETVQAAEGIPLPRPRAGHIEGAQTYGHLRIFATKITFPARRGRPEPDYEPGNPSFTITVRVATSMLPVEEQLATIRWVATSVAGVSVLCVAAFGWFLSRRVTRPLDLLGAAAARVRDGESDTIPRSGSGDEIDRLADLLDQAFAAVRSSVERQRQFVADASHELRTPVTILQSLAEIGQRHERSPAEYVELLQEIEQVAVRMTGMLESLLTLARLDASGRMPGGRVDLGEVARQVVEQACSQVQVTLTTEAAQVNGDAALLAILCRNLLANAVRHAKGAVDIQVARKGESVVLRVADDGPGLADAERQRVFERFFRGSSPGGAGAGLGLALVRSIANAHGGHCELLPSSVGLHVQVSLPAAT